MKSSVFLSARHVAVFTLALVAACSSAPEENDDPNPAPPPTESAQKQTLQSLVEAALPVIDVERIRRHIEDDTSLDPSAVVQFDALAQVVGPEGQFSFEPRRSRAIVTRELDMTAGIPFAREEAAAYMAELEAILDGLGIQTGERVVAAEPTFIMGRAFQTSEDGLQALSEPNVHGVTLEARRVVDRIPVDGSRVKMLFRGPGEVVLGDVTWPRFVIHPSIEADMTFKTSAELSAEIAGRLGPASGALPVVRAGVVYRPVQEAEGTFFVPALHVTRVAQGAAGEMFYVDLDANTPASLRPEP